MTIDPLVYPQPRTRHHTNPQFYLPLSQLHVVPSNYPPVPSTIDWQEIFLHGRAPRALDIGCGWGSFLMNYAEANPDINVLGIETRMQVTEWIQTVITGEHLANAHALFYSIANGLPFIADDSIDSVFYFFPDPWFKNRHSKRRAFTLEFLDELSRVMQPDGALYLMTDVPEVEEYQLKVLAVHQKFSVEKIDDASRWLSVQTDHELHCQRVGFEYSRHICRLRS